MGVYSRSHMVTFIGFYSSPCKYSNPPKMLKKVAPYENIVVIPFFLGGISKVILKQAENMGICLNIPCSIQLLQDDYVYV